MRTGGATGRHSTPGPGLAHGGRPPGRGEPGGQWQLLQLPTCTRAARLPAGRWQLPQAPLGAPPDMVLVLVPLETEMSSGGVSDLEV